MRRQWNETSRAKCEMKSSSVHANIYKIVKQSVSSIAKAIFGIIVAGFVADWMYWRSRCAIPLPLWNSIEAPMRTHWTIFYALISIRFGININVVECTRSRGIRTLTHTCASMHACRKTTRYINIECRVPTADTSSEYLAQCRPTAWRCHLSH